MEEGERHEENGGPPAGGAGGVDPETAELRARIGIKDNRIRELIQESTASRLASDEARAAREAAEEHVASVARDRDRLRERVRELEEGARARRRRREGIERQVERLEREVERLSGEIARRDYLL